MTSKLFREIILDRLFEDLVGPSSETEVLSDRPTQRYSTGILYPRDSEMGPDEDEDGGAPVNVAEDTSSTPDDSGVSLHATLKPSSAGMSFAVEPHDHASSPVVQARVRCAVYSRFGVDEEGKEIEGEPTRRSQERWRRTPIDVPIPIELQAGEFRKDLADAGAAGLELYVLVTPHAGLLTATAALSNRRRRGKSRAFDEEQHFFQVQLTIGALENGEFAPRPSRRAETDEDSRSAGLIYRTVREHVVGHTCSACAVNDKTGRIQFLATEWIPRVLVPGVSDRGDEVFEKLRQSGAQAPLQAAWLADASGEGLVEGLRGVVSAYREWIEGEQDRIEDLPSEFRPQAKRHVELCRRGADRMEDGVSEIGRDAHVRVAFQLAQRAMQMQFEWGRRGEALVWRPFQLAFQLLVLPSLANRSHEDRDTLDLLWFPTGGGKTEAYLALTAVVIFLRRIRSQVEEEASGVAVLMRYTLRLLTVQQFQRAASLICACELLRRSGADGADSVPDLGDVPIGIGLWVGAGATPLTLRDALNRPEGDPSTPEQLLTCPACGEPLNWRITPKESIVECSSESECPLSRSGSRLPIWTIDEEIYRHAPALLIGTVDKFAQIVRKLETRVLFGLGTRAAPPDLIIQDELHLISGPLGSMAGLYEVAIDELCRREGTRPKVVGSTATIRRAADQSRALFDRATYQFPSPGIDASNSGFAVTDDDGPGRLYAGVSTAGRSATYMLQAIVASLLQSCAGKDGPSLDKRDHYWTLVTYYNSLRELGRALVLMQDDVPISIGQIAAHRGEDPRRVETPAELTSRVKSYEIRDMLDQLKKRVGDAEAVDLLLASNMISVGMDIPRLGLMLVNAQPKTLSEYIQATSRVGRGGVPGLVITMYNNTRARDRSHFETFETWHKCLYRDVEATSVTPFASRAQDKALHAVLVALVRHLVPGMDQRPVLSDVRRADAERVASLIEQRVARVDPAEGAMVSQKLQRLLDQWSSRPDLQVYWDDYERRRSLLMSAEQFAAKADVDSDLDAEGARRALWPTPNSMREVEAGAPYILRHVLKSDEGS